VAQFPWFTFTGVFAWLLWLFVHILYLAGFRNRLSVLVEWGYEFVTWQRGVRLILNQRGGGPRDDGSTGEWAVPAITPARDSPRRDSAPEPAPVFREAPGPPHS
jgi:NADH dehydrogenase